MVQTDTVETIIRPMIAADIDAVYRIEVQTFTDSWPREAFTGWLGEDWTANFVALRAGIVVGYVCAVKQDDELHIHNIAVSALHRGRGIGRLLLTQAENWGRSKQSLCAILDVRASNSAAVDFYNALGYKKIGRRKEYYQSPTEDALVFMKVLPKDIAGQR